MKNNDDLGDMSYEPQNYADELEQANDLDLAEIAWLGRPTPEVEDDAALLDDDSLLQEEKDENPQPKPQNSRKKWQKVADMPVLSAENINSSHNVPRDRIIDNIKKDK